ncbi:hypothetical protein D3C79_887160 [compost metagenome]
MKNIHHNLLARYNTPPQRFRPIHFHTPQYPEGELLTRCSSEPNLAALAIMEKRNSGSTGISPFLYNPHPENDLALF